MKKLKRRLKSKPDRPGLDHPQTRQKRGQALSGQGQIVGKSTSPPNGQTHFLPGSRKGELFLALVLLVGLSAMFVWTLSWHHSAGLVDVDVAPRQPVPYIVDAGSAQWQDFAQIPGIGETLAKRIVAARTDKASFSQPEDLLKVHGIGESKLHEICKYVTFPSPSDSSTGNQPRKASGQ